MTRATSQLAVGNLTVEDVLEALAKGEEVGSILSHQLLFPPLASRYLTKLRRNCTSQG